MVKNRWELITLLLYRSMQFDLSFMQISIKSVLNRSAIHFAMSVTTYEFLNFNYYQFNITKNKFSTHFYSLKKVIQLLTKK